MGVFGQNHRGPKSHATPLLRNSVSVTRESNGMIADFLSYRISVSITSFRVYNLSAHRRAFVLAEY